MVSIFLAGRANKTVTDIISAWMSHPDGRIPAHSPNSDLMHSTTVPYTDIRPVRAALTSFSTQTIGKKVAREAESVVKLDSGLHVSIGKKYPETKLRREDFGEGTIPRVQAVIEEKQRVTLYLCNKIAMRRPRKRDGIVIERKTRPAAMVCPDYTRLVYHLTHRIYSGCHPCNCFPQLLPHGPGKSPAAHAQNSLSGFICSS
jgi:hypothetical protein